MASSRFIAKLESEGTADKLVVLIDADNAQASVIEGILAEVAKFGEAIVKRIYGDFTSTKSSSWKKHLQNNAIKPVQQFAYTTGKNATDSTMIIDAMDLLYTRKYDGFCLVTSDSDFTGLATRIKEEGLIVYGFGEQKTPDAFKKACNKFIFTEILRPESINDNLASGKYHQNDTKGDVLAKSDLSIDDFMRDALNQSSDENGWAHLGIFGSYLNQLRSDFDPRVYGYKKLSDLIKAKTDLFVTEERTTPGQTTTNIYLRAK